MSHDSPPDTVDGSGTMAKTLKLLPGDLLGDPSETLALSFPNS